MPLADATARLYISPLDASSLSRIIPPEKQAQIAAASYHTLPTLPYRPFAYLELPIDLAKSTKQKLNGSFLRGVKMRVEDARPEKRKRKNEATDEVAAESRAAAREERRSKRKRGTQPEEGVLKGLELSNGRKVKRGWADSDKQAEDTALVFRASVPPSATGNGAVKESKTKAKKAKRGEKTVTDVKEGDKTSKFPTFIRDEKPKGGLHTTEFVEGKGWVDEDGNVVEATVKASRARKTKPDVEERPLKVTTTTVADDKTPDITLTPAATVSDAANSVRSRSGSALPITSTEATVAAVEADKLPPSALESLFKRPAEPSSRSRSGRTKPAPVKTFSFFSSEAASDEAETVAGESSFASQNGETSDTTSTLVSEKGGKKRPKNLTLPPQTPFTRRDLDSRALRSAAPTPDTAAIGKRFRLWGREGSDASGSVEPRGASIARDIEDDDDDDTDDDDDKDDDAESAEEDASEHEDAPDANSAAAATAPPPHEAAEGTKDDNDEGDEQNDFEKHFYAERGEYNRAWKARKREARKSARQVENRRGLRGKG